MPKFILIDHSIRDLTGHHYEYATHVLRAAARAGYDPVLATNRSFAAPEDSEWPVLPVYELNFWSEPQASGLGTFLRSTVDWIRRVWFVRKCKLRYSHLGLAWLGRTQWAQYLARQPTAISAKGWHLAGIALILALKMSRFLGLLLLLPFVIAALPFRVSWRLISEDRLVQRYSSAITLEIHTYCEFFQTSAKAVRDKVRLRSTAVRNSSPKASRNGFLRDTATLFRQVQLSKGDMVFLPTLSHSDMLCLQKFFKDSQPDPGITWHLLFRRDLHAGESQNAPSGERLADEIRDAFQTFQQRSQSQKVYFYTDSGELSKQYNSLKTFQFHTLPIPHTHAPRRAKAPDGALQITYLGDARREKGYHLLPRIVGDLKREYVNTGRVKFAIQSNYNVPGGEPEAVVARTQLETLADKGVDLFKEPLSPEEYKDLLLSADIILLPYDVVSYQSRSSGILVEALSAGIPVIVPAGTWLSRQLQSNDNVRYLQSLRGRMAVVASYAHPAVSWYVHGTKDVDAMTDNKLELSATHKAYCWLRVPHRATHILVTLQFDREPYDACLNLTQLDEDEYPLASVSGLGMQWHEEQGYCVEVLHLHPEARKLWLALNGKKENEKISIQDAQVDFLMFPRSERVPIGATGLAYHNVDEISDLLREIVEHYPHYRRTASQNASFWRSFHNADRLIGDLQQRAGVLPEPRQVQPDSGTKEKALA